MAELAVLPVRGEVFLDARDGGRALRVSWHGEADVVVLSLWRGGKCAGTFQLQRDDLPRFVEALTRADLLRDGIRTRCHGDRHV
jgi:hypothetical protein